VSWQFIRAWIIQSGRRPFSPTTFSQQDAIFAADAPLQLRTLEASALLPNESMLKSAAAPNAAAAENLWVLVRLVIFLLLRFAILFDRWSKYGKIGLSQP
jgi:hypothetical protein